MIANIFFLQTPKLLENTDDCNRLQEDIESNKDSASDSDTESSESENEGESSNKTKSYRPREESPDSKRVCYYNVYSV